MTRVQYLVLLQVLTVSMAAPVVAAMWWADTIDWSPWLVLFGVGVVVAAGLFKPLLRAQRWFHAASKGFTRSVNPGLLVWLVPPMWCMAIGMFANAYLNSSPPEEHASELVRVTTGKNRNFYFREWRAAGGELRLSGGNRLVQGLAQGQAVTIVVHPGLLGWARIVAINPKS